MFILKCALKLVEEIILFLGHFVSYDLMKAGPIMERRSRNILILFWCFRNRTFISDTK